MKVLKTLDLTDSRSASSSKHQDGDIYRCLPKARMALMLRLEALVSDGSKKQAFAHSSLEHVLPQTPPNGSEWMTWFPDDDARDSWTHRLANLVPLHARVELAKVTTTSSPREMFYFSGKGVRAHYPDQCRPLRLDTGTQFPAISTAAPRRRSQHWSPRRFRCWAQIVKLQRLQLKDKQMTQGRYVPKWRRC